MVKKYLYIATIALMAASCSESTMDDINKDTTNPPVSAVPVNLQITDAIMSTGFTTVSGAYSWYVSSYTEQEFGTGNNQLKNVELRNKNEMAASTTFSNEWNGTYSNLQNLKQIIDKINTSGGTNEGQYDILGMAQLLYANNFGILTDLHGDIPCSEALQGLANTTPKLDSQKDIYTNCVLKNIDDAIASFKKAIDEGITGSDGYAGSQDILFQNDCSKWLASAYALKARYLLHTMVQNPAVLDDVIAACNNAIANGFDGMDLKCFDGNSATNPWYAYYESREYTASSTTVINLMKERSDRRENVYAFPYYYNKAKYEFLADPGDEDGAQSTGGLCQPAWLSYQRTGKDPASVDCGGGAASVHIMSKTELYFILAEAQARKGIDASSAFNTAVSTSLSDYDAFLPQYTTEYNAYVKEVNDKNATLPEADKITPKAYSDFLPGSIATYIKNSVTPLFTANPLKEIMVQKYISQCRDEQIEGYNDLRRCTALGETFVEMKNPKNVNGLPIRLPYGNSSVISNPAVKAAFGDGSYIFTSKEWIFGGK